MLRETSRAEGLPVPIPVGPWEAGNNRDGSTYFRWLRGVSREADLNVWASVTGTQSQDQHRCCGAYHRGLNEILPASAGGGHGRESGQQAFQSQGEAAWTKQGPEERTENRA